MRSCGIENWALHTLNGVSGRLVDLQRVKTKDLSHVQCIILFLPDFIKLLDPLEPALSLT